MNEYLLSLNPFNKPKILEEKDAIYTLLIRLILLEPNTFPTHPNMGVGIVSRYRYSDFFDLEKLKVDITNQVIIYLPELIPVTVEVGDDGVNIIIQITSNGTLYELTFNKETRSLSDIKGGV